MKEQGYRRLNLLNISATFSSLWLSVRRASRREWSLMSGSKGDYSSAKASFKRASNSASIVGLTRPSFLWMR